MSQRFQLKVLEICQAWLEHRRRKILSIPYDYARPMIEFVSEKNGKTSDLVGAEIGVYRGDNAVFILSTLPIKKLFLIDPYREYMEYKHNVGWSEHSQADFDNDFRIAKEKLTKFKDKVEFIVKKSEDAAGDVPNSLDFVYIDGNHEYEFIKRDIELYYPKVKDGGVIGGDNFESIFPSVARAVLEFAGHYDLSIHGARSAASYEWWVIKTGKRF